ncbi:hypothetical protein [Streptomyces sasae]|uniref:hypothetical protein n=1 Tax=Streptomyces sasae TaxID=1266772 RepID=UPI002931A714|nr:hypothetical protein [Streptomyces sasae]
MSAWLYMILGAVILAGAQTVVRRLRMPPATCSWCARASGHQVTGHTADQCRGPVLAQQQRTDIDAAHERDLARKDSQLSEQAARRQAEKERHAARLRILQVGTMSTRRTGRGNSIIISGWIFDRTTGPRDASTLNGAPETFATTGAPERTHGWTLTELHAMVHGGACTCDVVTLARTAAH